MLKTDLPVILLRGITLIPNNDLKIEFDNETSKSIIDVSELFHNRNILVVTTNNPLEENIDLEKLPKIGVISKIEHRMELPNGKTRVIIKGIERAKIYEYLNLGKGEDLIEAIASSVEDEQVNNEDVLIQKLFRELEGAIKKIPYLSNGFLAKLNNIKSLAKMTDIVVPHLPISLERINEYLEVTSSSRRMEMILEDLYKENQIFNIEHKIDSKVKSELDKNQKEYMLREKLRLIKEELGDVSSKDDDIELITEKIKSLNASDKIKIRLKQELQRYENLTPMSPELNIVRNYIDWLLDLPWDNKTIDNDDFVKVKQTLDSSHYGLDKVKTRIIEFLAVNKMTDSLRSPIICLVGPPGVGKTSLASSIANAINRNFVKISVGGINDEAEITGHRRTYLGANPGRIIQSMKKAKSSNPVFLIDEIDKMTKDIKGDPASALLEVLDPEQNKFFSDNYIEEEVDLSNVMFIATANYENDIPEALKDRLEIVRLSSYTEYEKLDIAINHLLPKICNEHGLDNKYIKFSKESLLKIIRSYTKEPGVRELERQISSIVRKIVTSIVTTNIKPKTLNITVDNVEKYLGKEIHHFPSYNTKSVGVVNGLAYTYVGGDVLSIEVNFYKGNGDLILTGSLGKIMKESAQIALSYIKANYKKLGVNYSLFKDYDIHVHVPALAIPKDGPSAGITLTTALISAINDKPVEKDIAMTGEITLRGDILPIGGLKEKSIGAHRNGVRTILIPYANLCDLDDIPKEIKNDINYITVKNYDDVYNYLFKKN